MVLAWCITDFFLLVQLILYSGSKAATQKDDIMLIASHQHEAVELDKLSVRETVSVLVRIVDVESRDLYEGETILVYHGLSFFKYPRMTFRGWS